MPGWLSSLTRPSLSASCDPKWVRARSPVSRNSLPARSLITVKGKTAYRHTVSNAAEVLAVLRKRRHVLALGGHFHAAEKLVYEIEGVRTHFDLAAAIISPTNTAGLHFPSGVTLYTVRDGVIDDGRFVALGIPERMTP